MILRPADLQQIETTILRRLTVRTELAHTPRFAVTATLIEYDNQTQVDGWVDVKIHDSGSVVDRYLIPGHVIRRIASQAMFESLLNVWFRAVGTQAIGVS